MMSEGGPLFVPNKKIHALSGFECLNAEYQSLSEADSDTDSDDDLFFAPSYNSQQHYWSSIHSSLPSTPRPPRTLLDLIHRMGLKEF